MQVTNGALVLRLCSAWHVWQEWAGHLNCSTPDLETGFAWGHKPESKHSWKHKVVTPGFFPPKLNPCIHTYCVKYFFARINQTGSFLALWWLANKATHHTYSVFLAKWRHLVWWNTIDSVNNLKNSQHTSKTKRYPSHWETHISDEMFHGTICNEQRDQRRRRDPRSRCRTCPRVWRSLPFKKRWNFMNIKHKGFYFLNFIHYLKFDI